MISLKNVEKKFGDVNALDNVSLDIKKGDTIAYVGPNGAGKTTTIRLILGLLKPTNGTVEVFGEDPYESLGARKRIGFLLDHPGVDEDLTAWENLKFYSMVYGAHNNIDDVLKKVELYDVKDKLVKTFSRGMKQRLSIAPLFLRTPEAIIMDEPTFGLDVDGRILVRELIKEFASYNVPTLISSHDLFELQQICNKVVIILNGKIVKSGTMAHILESESDEYQITIRGNISDELLTSLQEHNFVSYNAEEKRISVRLINRTISDAIERISREVEIIDIEKKKTSLEEAYRRETDER